MTSMSRTRMAAAVVASVLAGCAVAAPSASAAEWFVKGTKLTGSDNMATTARLDTTLSLVSGAAGVLLLCTGGALGLMLAGAPVMTAANIWKAESLTFMGCSVMLPAECTVQAEIQTVPVEGTMRTSTGQAVTEAIKPQTGKLIAEIEFTGAKCSAAGSQPVAGQVTTFMATGQTEWAMQPEEGLGTMENNSLFIGPGHAYLEAGRSLLLTANGLPFSFH